MASHVCSWRTRSAGKALWAGLRSTRSRPQDERRTGSRFSLGHWPGSGSCHSVIFFSGLSPVSTVSGRGRNGGFWSLFLGELGQPAVDVAGVNLHRP